MYAGYIIIFLIIFLLSAAFYPGNYYKAVISVVRHTSGLTKKRIKIDKDEIVYLEGGTGQNMLLLHGFGANKDNWLKFSKLFTPSYHVVVPDLAGFGESSYFPEGEYNVEAQVERLHNFTKALNVDTFYLAGNSMGGQIAAFYANKYPGQVLAMVLFDAAGIDEINPSELALSLKDGSNPLVTTALADYERLLKFVFHQAPAYPKLFFKGLAEDSAQHLESNNRIFAELNDKWIYLESILPQLECPVLVIWGKNDRVIDVSCVEGFKSRLKKGNCVIMDNCGHMPMLEKSDESAKLVTEFISQLK